MPPFGYCERTSAAFFAEPLNAITNAAFLIAAFLIARRLAAEGWRDRPAIVLTALVGIIGIGSFLFHTMPSRATLLADVIPIQLFAFGYFFAATRRFLGFGLGAGLIATAAFFGLAVALSAFVVPLLPGPLRGSAGYGVFLLGLIGVGLVLRAGWGERDAGLPLIAAGALFAVSLTLRTADPLVCGAWPMGTHFLWHLLNAGVLFVLLATHVTFYKRRM